MANILPPRIQAPISECSTRIRVQSQFPGADVEVVDTSNATVVASGTATSADETFPVTSPLMAGHTLAARQILGTSDSGLSVDTVMVQKKPTPVGGVSFRTTLFECGRCLWLDGLVPGATVTVSDGTTSIGSGESYDGVARVHLSQALQTSSQISARQVACGEPGMKTTAPAPLPMPRDERRLPPPKVESPLVECSHRVTVSEVIPGATVELVRSAGPNLGGCFDLPALWFGVNPPLSAGETVMARQSFPDCHQISGVSPGVVVDPLVATPPPTVNGPLCTGSTNVTVCGLKAGARVRITIAPAPHHGFPTGGTTYEATAPGDGCFDFALASGLPSDTVVYATQELCGRESIPSNVVTVDPEPASLPKPIVSAPLYECAILVHVQNLHPGSRVYVVSESIGVIGEAQVFGPEADVSVAPLLAAGDQIFAYAIGCGKTSPESDRVRVGDLPQLVPPRVLQPLYSCEHSVRVGDVVPGAWVDVFVNGTWRGRAAAAQTEVEVQIQIGTLAVGDVVAARQILCGRVSEIGRVVVVQKFDGRWVRIGDDAKSDILAVHAALLPTGKILIFAGDMYDGANRLPNTPNVDNARLMGTQSPNAMESITGLPGVANLFCAGQCMLEDGSVLAAGGTDRAPTLNYHQDHWFGIRESWRFVGLPAGSEQWSAAGHLSTARPGDVRGGFAADQSGGRWYPTLVTLADGRALALGGHPMEGDFRHTNTSLELYDPATNAWSLVGSQDYDNIPGASEVPGRGSHSEYPRMHVLRDSSLFVVSDMADGDVHRWQPYDDSQAWTRVAGAPPGGYTGNPQPYTSVLLPLLHEREYAPEVMVIGRETAYKIAPLGASPAWTAAGARNLVDYPTTGAVNPPRQYPLATLLPSGEVLVAGGTVSGRDDTALRKAEMYDSRNGTWRVLPEAERVRNYHSTALLMPNGAVWHSGSNRDCEPGPGTRDRTVEVFEPWYFCEWRPVITAASARVCAGDELHIETPHASEVAEVALVRCGSFTHAFNSDQRLVSLPFRKAREAGHIIAFTPANNGVLVPGYYLVFVLTAEHVPSEGRFVQICRARPPRPWRIDPAWLAELVRVMEEEGFAIRRRVPWPPLLEATPTVRAGTVPTSERPAAEPPHEHAPARPSPHPHGAPPAHPHRIVPAHAHAPAPPPAAGGGHRAHDAMPRTAEPPPRERVIGRGPAVHPGHRHGGGGGHH